MLQILLLSITAGVFVGSAVGSFGGGGSTIAIPTLVYLIGLTPREAIATSLIVVGSSAFSGFLHNMRHRSVDFRIGLIYGATGIVGTQFGSHLSQYFSGLQQLIVFSVIVFLAAISMLKKAFFQNTVEESFGKTRSRLFFSLMAGFLIGVVTGLAGVGGGFLIVPILNSLGLPLKRAIGTSLFVITINAYSGALGYIRVVDYDFYVLIPFVVAAILFSQVGARLIRRLPTVKLKKIYAIFLFLLGVFLIVKNGFEIMNS